MGGSFFGQSPCCNQCLWCGIWTPLPNHPVTIMGMANIEEDSRTSEEEPFRQLQEEDKAVDALTKALGDEDDWVRFDAAGALGKIGSDFAVDALIKAFRDDDEATRSQAAEALGKIGSNNAVEALFEAWENTEDITQDDLTDILINLENQYQLLTYFNKKEFNDFFGIYSLKTKIPFYQKDGKWFYFDQKFHKEMEIS